MKIMRAVFFSFLLVGCIYGQSEWRDTTDITEWKEAPDIKFVNRLIQFKPELDMGGGGRKLPQIRVDVSFINMSQKTIKSATFEILLFCQMKGLIGNQNKYR